VRFSTRKHARGEDGLLFGHPTSQSLVEGLASQADDLAPFGDGLRIAAHGDTTVRAHVSSLLGVGCPSAVSRFVVPVDIDSIDRELARWSSAHVGKKVFERLPASANLDATTAVDVELVVPRVLATREHLGPCAILGRLLSVAAFAVTALYFGAVLASAIDSIAATRLGSARAQQEAGQHLLGAAGAATKPSDLPTMAGWTGSDNRPSSEATTCEFVPRCHLVNMAQKGQKVKVKMAQRIG
jgi:hypothetical protein